MNIFALHPNQRKCARWYVDKHVVKMLLETVQLLYTAHWALAYPILVKCKSPIELARTHKQYNTPPTMHDAPVALSTGCHYRPSHINHPCAKWARRTLGNYNWLAILGVEIAREFKYRFGHTHACEAHVMWLLANPPHGIRRFPRMMFSIAMDEQYKISDDPIRSYRNYYRTSKADMGLIHYTKRHIPHWIRI